MLAKVTYYAVFSFNRIIVSLVAYFIIGALLMKFQFHASGTDVIPNKTFWIQLPLLIKVHVKQGTIKGIVSRYKDYF